jgi:hypothetical protein
VRVMGDATLAVGDGVEVVARGPSGADAPAHGVVDADQAAACVAREERGGAVGAAEGAGPAGGVVVDLGAAAVGIEDGDDAVERVVLPLRGAAERVDLARLVAPRVVGPLGPLAITILLGELPGVTIPRGLGDASCGVDLFLDGAEGVALVVGIAAAAVADEGADPAPTRGCSRLRRSAPAVSPKPGMRAPRARAGGGDGASLSQTRRMP